MATVIFQPMNRAVEIAPGTTLLKAAQKGGVELPWACGGNRICTTCRCLVEGKPDSLSATDEKELEILDTVQLAEPWRLGCQARVLRDVTVRIPSDLSIPPGETN